MQRLCGRRLFKHFVSGSRFFQLFSVLGSTALDRFFRARDASLTDGCLVAADADQKIALLGAMQSLFEGSMYTFVFLWTPALSPKGEHLPHGMIFACFMVRCCAHRSVIHVQRHPRSLIHVNSVRVDCQRGFWETRVDETNAALPGDGRQGCFGNRLQDAVMMLSHPGG